MTRVGGHGSLLSPEQRTRLRGGAVPFALALGRLGLTPDLLTVLGFGVACVAALLAGLELWLAASVVMVGGALFDTLDGALARALDRATRFGAFLDSTVDRWGESVVYAGISFGGMAAREPTTVLLSSLAMASALMVSYTRAKAESLGFHGEVGIAPRPERIAILAVGLALAGVAGGPASSPWLQLSLAALFTLSTITTLQRVWHVRRQARSEEEGRP